MVRCFCPVNSEWAYMGRIVLIMFYEMNNSASCYWLVNTAYSNSFDLSIVSLHSFHSRLLFQQLYLHAERTSAPKNLNSLLSHVVPNIYAFLSTVDFKKRDFKNASVFCLKVLSLVLQKNEQCLDERKEKANADTKNMI